MTKEKKNRIFILLGVLGIGSFIAVWLGNENFIKMITEEDGIIENLSAIFYLAGFSLCLFRILKKTCGVRLWLYLWCFLCFVFLGEEMSWFQRFFNYPVLPFIKELNEQGEVNLHNLNIFQGGHWIGAISSKKYGLKMFLSSQNIFRLCFLLYFLVVPITIYVGKMKVLERKFRYPVPEPGFVVAIWSVLVLSFVLSVFSLDSIKSSIAETREMFYALFIFLYVFMYLRSSKSDSKTAID